LENPHFLEIVDTSREPKCITKAKLKTNAQEARNKYGNLAKLCVFCNEE
jgi:hypothetical protein